MQRLAKVVPSLSLSLSLARARAPLFYVCQPAPFTARRKECDASSISPPSLSLSLCLAVDGAASTTFRSAVLLSSIKIKEQRKNVSKNGETERQRALSVHEASKQPCVGIVRRQPGGIKVVLLPGPGILFDPHCREGPFVLRDARSDEGLAVQVVIPTMNLFGDQRRRPLCNLC